MSINVILRNGIALAAVLSSIPAYAACTAISQNPVVVNMQMGRVIVSSDLPVGSVIKEQQFPMPSNVGTYALCDGQTPMEAIVTAVGMAEGANKVYSTNVPGIGLRFERLGSISMIYPDVYKINGNPWQKFSVSLATSTFKLQVIKIAENTGSGTINAGEYTRYGYQVASGGMPALITRLDANAITIVSPSCKITTGKNQDVILPPVNRTEFRGIGTTAGEKQFPINLLCNGGISISPDSIAVNMTFGGTKAPNTPINKGVLDNAVKNSMAQGIGVQVLTDKNKELEWGKIYKVGELISAQDKEIRMNYIARYYQFGSKISAGEVEAKMLLNITYD
ncbi:type 1 fimbrial protein [Providencia rettgeri]|uniref:Fimbria adhesin protein n=1 Tax=Proteus penneri TaxID=102862 RepID=A0A0G4Q5D0_9GAMM|nr:MULTISPECIES: fimbrial protein [Morganellaceae]MBN7864276.1 type 1 fimbrial protein [Providencia rettgeri]MBN7874054.1 type 1 fimbrial protein [Providencia rettgeri]MBN7898854.1 type 1 fimbrial protein [Providencia rettgeri]MBO2804028.1 type 1 fimbrial protein [Providencia rettgeri]MBO2867269.1 type 1 fimbrial protein [Providencia rettgeri]